MGIIFTIAVVLLIAWILGLLLHIAGGFIHIVLVVALLLFIWGFFTRR